MLPVCELCQWHNHSMNEQPAGIGDGWRVLRLLGEGGEGVVYLIEDKATSRRWVLKSFHSPLPAPCLQSLQIYNSGILAGDCPGLPEFELVQDRDSILGVRYPYVALYHVHWRILRSIGQIGKALVGSYCQLQHHLISRLGIAIWDADPVNFMLARDGYFYWIDFGTAMEVVNRPTGESRGGFEYGFATLLLGIHGINFKLLAQYSESYTYAGPCIYFMNAALDDVACRHHWVREIVETVRSQRAAAFLEPEFYRQLGAGLPRRVIAPTAIIASGALLFRAGGLRARLRNS
jgi:hypothetical protein